jgi:hypothetical protein
MSERNVPGWPTEHMAEQLIRATYLHVQSRYPFLQVSAVAESVADSVVA